MVKKIHLFIGALTTVMWGANFSIIEMGLRDLNSFSLTLLRFFFTAVPLIFFIPRPKEISILWIAFYGVIFGTGLWWLVNFAMYKGLSPGLSSLILQFSAFFTIIMSNIFFKERISLQNWIGMGVSFVGLMMIIHFSNLSSTKIGIELTILAAVSWAVCNLIIKKTQPQNVIGFIVWSSLFAVPVLLTMSIIVNGGEELYQIPQNITFNACISVLFQSFITTILGYSIWNKLMKTYPASDVAPLSLLVPISGILTSYVFFDEILSNYQFISMGVVIIGLFIFMLSGKTFVRLFFSKINPCNK